MPARLLRSMEHAIACATSTYLLQQARLKRTGAQAFVTIAGYLPMIRAFERQTEYHVASGRRCV